MKVLANDPYRPVDQPGVQAAGFEEVLGSADFVVCLAVATEETENLIDRAALARMKPDAYFINLSRGNLVDEAALAEALRASRLRTYAADVLSSEAGSHDNPLLADDLLDRTVFTPHTGAQTVEAVDAMGRAAVDAVLAVLRGERPPNVVPLPAPASGGPR